jgi:hypothetical protein
MTTKLEQVKTDRNTWMGLAIFAVSGLIFIVFLSSLSQDEFKDKYYNLQAELKCPTKTYLSESFGDNITCNITYNNKFEIIAKECPINKFIINYNNFTTGRYIDGKIECQAINYNSCPDFLKYCREQGIYCDCERTYNHVVKSQNFTLEEMGLK